MKNLFRAFALVLFIGATAQAAESVTAVASTDENINVISISGAARTEVMPDMANIQLAVVTKAETAKEAQAANAVNTKHLAEALVGQVGIQKNDFKTTGYTVSPEYTYPEKAAPVLVGYVAQHLFNITVKDVNRVGEVLDMAGQSGVSSIIYVQFGLVNQKTYQLEALKTAMGDALAKAQVIAAAAGRTIKRVVRVSQAEYHFESPRNDMAKEYAPGTQIYPQMVTVSADLTVDYEF